MKLLPLPTPLLPPLPTPLLPRLPTPLLTPLPLQLRPRPAPQARLLPQARPLPQPRFQIAVRLSLFLLLPSWFSWRWASSDQRFQRSPTCGRGGKNLRLFVCSRGRERDRKAPIP